VSRPLSVDARARALLAAHPLVDGHNDLPFAVRQLVGYDLSRYDLAQRQQRTHTDLIRLADGGVGGQFWSVYVPASWAGERAVSATLEQIDFVHRMVARYPSQLRLATTAADVATAHREGRIACLLGAEGGHSIDSSLGVLRMYGRLGVRYLTLTHNDNVPWADSATDVVSVGGLAPFGRDVVRELNAAGMLVDLSHTAPATMRDALEVTAAPVIFSHSSARALCDHVRNVPDDILARLAGNGGVCMVTFVPAFVSEDCRAWDEAVLADMAEHGEDRRDWAQHMAAAARRAAVDPPPVATVGQVADHIEHVREVAGAGHVGIGSDFDGWHTMPVGLQDVSGYPALIAELAGRAWSDRDVAQLTRENILRVLHDAEQVAAGRRR
jgi:membrane dipeptidase